jgi:hypothetical protein
MSEHLKEKLKEQIILRWYNAKREHKSSIDLTPKIFGVICENKKYSYDELNSMLKSSSGDFYENLLEDIKSNERHS